jgi:hypothetical protein
MQLAETEMESTVTTACRLEEELRLVDEMLAQIEHRRADARRRLNGLAARLDAMSSGERLVGGRRYETEVSAVAAEMHQLQAATSLTTAFLQVRDRELQHLDEALH